MASFTHGIAFSSATSQTLSRHAYFRQRELDAYMICGPVAVTVGLFNDMLQKINKPCFLPPVLYTLSLSTCVHNMHVSPR